MIVAYGTSFLELHFWRKINQNRYLCSRTYPALSSFKAQIESASLIKSPVQPCISLIDLKNISSLGSSGFSYILCSRTSDYQLRWSKFIIDDDPSIFIIHFFIERWYFVIKKEGTLNFPKWSHRLKTGLITLNTDMTRPESKIPVFEFFEPSESSNNWHRSCDKLTLMVTTITRKCDKDLVTETSNNEMMQ